MKAALPNLQLELTARCNLRCRYCYLPHKRPGARPPAEASYRQLKRTLKRVFARVALDGVTMTGGEPFLADRFSELVLWCRLQGKAVNIISNGNAAGAADYAALVDLGVDWFEFPLLAPAPAAHDALTRVPGSWQRARDSIAQVVAAGGRVAGVVVATAENRDGVPATMELLAELGAARILINRFNVGGAGLAERERLELDRAGLRGLFAAVDRSARGLDVPVSANVCTPACALDPADTPALALSFCTAVAHRRPLTMNAWGDLRMCNHSPVVLGNLLQQNLESILASPAAAAWERRPAFCAACSRWHPCHGGCRAAAEQLGWGLEHEDPICRRLGLEPFKK